MSAPHVIAREIVDDLEAALEQFREIAEDLEEKNAATPAPIVQRPAPRLTYVKPQSTRRYSVAAFAIPTYLLSD
jgi:hypothetical protein